MKEMIEEVLGLQQAWSRAPTDAMVRRGRVIAHDIRGWLTPRVVALRTAVDIHDLAVDASDGAGAKAKVPWVRVFSESRSPGASEGWYLVLLFAADGSAAFLSINQGSTKWAGGNFEAPRSLAELEQRAAWARTTVADLLPVDRGGTTSIDLAVDKHDLGRRYESGNVIAIEYPAADVPSEKVITADIRYLTEVLRAVYAIEENSLQLPGDPAPELIDAAHDADAQANPRRPRARRRLTHAENEAIATRAVCVAMEHLRSLGYQNVKDVGARESYDIRAERDGSMIRVEVKGTTSDGSRVVLTANEVELHRKNCPATMLIVVSGITLDRASTPPIATAGLLHRWDAWAPKRKDLSAIAYYYEVPPAQSTEP